MPERETVTDLEREFFYARKKLPQIYTDYLDYARDVKKLEISTIQNRKSPVLRFLLVHSSKNTYSTIKKITGEEVQEHTIKEAAPLTRNMKRQLVIALRDFFRFLHLYGHTEKDLSESVPTITTYRMAKIPRGMPWETVEAILKTVNQKTFSGKRDYAIILIFARYGIRATQLRSLLLQDIDWKNKTIYFHEKKGGKEILAPLYEDVEEALISYFKAGRMKADKQYTQVFLKTGTGGSKAAGQVPLRDSTWNIVNLALRRAMKDKKINHAHGPHAIRHAFATKLLDKDTPLKSISDLLGHRSINTTFIYTKSSLPKLRELSLEWPTRSN